jgi:hypothetical protein
MFFLRNKYNKIFISLFLSSIFLKIYLAFMICDINFWLVSIQIITY